MISPKVSALMATITLRIEEVNKIVNAATKKFLTKQKASNKVSDKDDDTDCELNHFNELELSDIESDDDYAKL